MASGGRVGLACGVQAVPARKAPRWCLASAYVARSTGVRGLIDYFRENPQVFVLLVVCVVLGLGTFIAVIISLIAAGNTQTTGEPSGVITFLLTIR